MANDFTGDSNCVALWRFEDGALTADTIGTNTLTNNAAVVSNEVDFQEGAASADFEVTSTQYFSIADGDLDAGFPLKNGDANKKISVCGWFQLESINTGWRGLFSKFDTNGLRSLSIGVEQLNGKFVILLGYNNGDSGEFLYRAGALVTGRFYHYGFTYQDSDKAWKLVVWDDTAESKIIDVSGTATNNISIETATVGIGVRYFATGTATDTMDGEIDETVVFKDILTTGEIDQIRQGVFGVASFAISVAENVVASEALDVLHDGARNINLSDVVAVTEAVTVFTASLILISVSDTVAVSEFIDAIRFGLMVALDVNVSDVVEISDVLIDILRDGSRDINLSDSVAVTEVIGRLLDLNPNVIDAVTATEYNKMLLISFVDANETIRVKEFIRSEVFLVLEASVNSPVGITEVVSSDIHFPVNVSDAIAAAEDYGLYKTPGGGGRMTFSGKKPKITFTGAAPKIIFTGAAPKITFSIN